MDYEKAKKLKVGQKIYYLYYPNFDFDICSLKSGKIKQVFYSIECALDSGTSLILEDGTCVWYKAAFTSKREALKGVRSRMKKAINDLDLFIKTIRRKKNKIHKAYIDLFNN